MLSSMAATRCMARKSKSERKWKFTFPEFDDLKGACMRLDANCSQLGKLFCWLSVAFE